MKLKKTIDSPFKEGAKAYLVTRPAWFTIKGNSVRVMHSYYKCEATGEEFYFGNTWRINNKYLMSQTQEGAPSRQRKEPK